MSDQSSPNTESLYTALRNADKSGDTEGAAKLAQYIKSLGTRPEPAQPTDSGVPDVSRGLKLAGRAVARGLEGLAGIPGDIESLLPSNSKNGLSLTSEASAAGRFFPTGQELMGKNLLGVENNPGLQPETKLEKFGSAAVSGAVDAIPILASGGGLLPALITSEAGSLAGEAVNQLSPPGAKWAPVAAAVAASMGAGGLVSKYQKLRAGWKAAANLDSATQAWNDAKDSLKAVGYAGAEAGNVAKLALANAKSKSQAMLDQTKSFISDVGSQISAQAKQTANWVADKLGTGSNLESVGKIGQDEGRKWIDEVLPKKDAALIKPVNDVMGTESVGIGGLKSVIDNIPKTKLAALKNNLPPDLLETFTDAIELGKPIPWNDARRLRTEIGTMLKDNKISADIGDKRLEAMYSANTADLRSAAKLKGVEKEFDTYNAEMTKLYDFRDNVVNKFITSTNPNKALDQLPGQAAKGFLRRAQDEGTEMAAMRAEMPQTANEMASYQLRTGSWGKLSSGAKVALVPDPAHRAALDQSIASMEKASNTGADIIDRAGLLHKDVMAAENRTQLEAAVARARVRQNAQQVVDRAKNGVISAQNAIPAQPSPINNLTHQVRAGIAATGLNMLLPSLGPMGTAAAALGGYMLPAAYRAGKKMMQNPKSLLTPATGALAGENALTQPEKQK